MAGALREISASACATDSACCFQNGIPELGGSCSRGTMTSKPRDCISAATRLHVSGPTRGLWIRTYIFVLLKQCFLSGLVRLARSLPTVFLHIHSILDEDHSFSFEKLP